MPDPNEYESEKEFMAACVPKRMDEGDEQDQAVAVCMGMWEKKSVDIEAKIGARNSRSDGERLQMIHDYSVENGAQCQTEEPNDDEEEKALGEDTIINFGGEIKALSDGKIGGYLVRFSGPDDPDASPQRDFFTANTDYGFKRGERKSTPIYFNHRMPIKSSDGKQVWVKDRIGDGEMEITDDGVLIEAILYNRKRYEAALGAMGWSSGTAPHLVDRRTVKEANEVLSWPLGLDGSITPMPAEPRNEVIPLKSLGDYASLLPPLPPDPETVDAERIESKGDGGEPINNIQFLEVEMEPEELKTLMAEAAEAGARKALADLPAETKNIGNVTVPLDAADQPWKDDGEYFRAVKTVAYYPNQEDPRLRPLKATGLSEGVPGDGGYLLPTNTSTTIVQRMLDTGKIFSRVAKDPITSGNTMVYNGVDETTHVGSLYGGIVGYWLAEAADKTKSKPKFYQVQLKLKKIAALVYATDEQLEDTPNLESWIMRTVPQVLTWYVESAIVNGDGVGKPLGFANAANPSLIQPFRLDANEVNPDDFATMWSRRWTGANDYVWLINPTVAAWMNMFAVGTFPVYMPAGSMVGVPYGTLYGAPVIETEHVAAAKSANDILLVSLSNYQTITKGGVQAAKSVEVAFTTDETAFRFVYRIDGAPLWHSSLTPENGATVSPFVGLAAASS